MPRETIASEPARSQIKYDDRCSTCGKERQHHKDQNPSLMTSLPYGVYDHEFLDMPAILSVSRLTVSWDREADVGVRVAVLGPEGQVLEPTPEHNGWTLELDRQGVNDLIKYLRRSRDQVFGKDA